MSGEQVGSCPDLADSGAGVSPGLAVLAAAQAFSPLSASPSAGSVDDEVTQSPRHLVKGKEQKARMECVPRKGHSYVYWYHRKLEGALTFLVYLQNDQIIERADAVKERFSFRCPPNSPCSLEIQPTGPGDSAQFFCASSQYTVLRCQLLLEHKCTMHPAQETSGTCSRRQERPETQLERADARRKNSSVATPGEQEGMFHTVEGTELQEGEGLCKGAWIPRFPGCLAKERPNKKLFFLS